MQLGKFMFEVKRPGVSKGEAVRALMEQAPFAGRQPVFVGDDVTDELVFAILPEMARQRLFGRPAISPGLAGIFESPRLSPRLESDWRHAGRVVRHDRLRP